MKLFPVILSGGSGSRLWPLSRAHLPKQLLPLVSEHSLLQDTVLRLSGLDVSGPVIVCNESQRFLVAEQLREISLENCRIVLEPIGRNTAPAIAAAALCVLDSDPHGLMLVLPADHMILNVSAFREAVGHASSAAQEGSLVTFGVVPTSPETGYGYIQATNNRMDGLQKVVSFVEKPSLDVAKDYLAKGNYFWNSGMFLCRADFILNELVSYQPEVFTAVDAAWQHRRTDLDFIRLDEAAFRKAPSISIDYAVMENTRRALVMTVDMGWSDVGSWKALWQLHAGQHSDGNVTRGDVYLDTVRDSYVRAESRMVAVVGLDDVVVVETPDAVLVAHKDKAQDVKKIVDFLSAANRTEHLSNTRVYRPWGWYEGLDAGDRFQVKRILVKPGQKLSLQMHHHRAEHWIVVHGTAKITRGAETVMLSENESTYIPLGVIHRLENPGKIPLQIVEVQSGSYLGEDDIVRLEDSYLRLDPAE
jgi:mannose-1-phosphate guanylyltransferase/mannose-6-phosphate isomerase